MSGADLLQRVRLASGHCCGPKDDQHAIGAELAVIVTAAMPKEARLWKKREARLERMQDGLLSVVGDLQGIGEDGLAQLDVVASLPEIAGE